MKYSRVLYEGNTRSLFENIVLQISLFAMISGVRVVNHKKLQVEIEKIRKKEHKILVIDDDDKFRNSLCFKLTRVFKAQVDNVNSGRLGIEKLKEGNKYDFIFTDIMMPEMTGIETYYELREISSQIKIIIMSAYSSSEEWKKASELKDVMLLHKPISDDELIKTFN